VASEAQHKHNIAVAKKGPQNAGKFLGKPPRKDSRGGRGRGRGRGGGRGRGNQFKLCTDAKEGSCSGVKREGVLSDCHRQRAFWSKPFMSSIHPWFSCLPLAVSQARDYPFIIAKSQF
jgi:hypothetical protein